MHKDNTGRKFSGISENQFPPSLRDLFVEQLEHLILSGKLKIGEQPARRNAGLGRDDAESAAP